MTVEPGLYFIPELMRRWKAEGKFTDFLNYDKIETFADFGGVRIDPDSGQVIDSDMNPIPGLYAAGELVGGIFYFNYPGGSGLMSGAVFGRIAGAGASAAMRNA